MPWRKSESIEQAIAANPGRGHGRPDRTHALPLAEQAQAEQLADLAQSLINSAHTAARKVRNPDLIKKIAPLRRQIQKTAPSKTAEPPERKTSEQAAKKVGLNVSE